MVAGDGPERTRVIAAQGTNVRYEGLVDADRIHHLLDEAAVIVIPSLCYEGFPRVVAEAFERGRPIAATALGTLCDLITPDVGWTADPNVQSVAAMIAKAASDPSLATKGANARAEYESQLTPEVSLARLLDVYPRALATTSQRSPGRGSPGAR